MHYIFATTIIFVYKAKQNYCSPVSDLQNDAKGKLWILVSCCSTLNFFNALFVIAVIYVDILIVTHDGGEGLLVTWWNWWVYTWKDHKSHRWNCNLSSISRCRNCRSINWNVLAVNVFMPKMLSFWDNYLYNDFFVYLSYMKYLPKMCLWWNPVTIFPTIIVRYLC